MTSGGTTITTTIDEDVAAPPTGPRRPTMSRRTLVRVLGVLAVVALVAAVAGGFYWWLGTNGPSASTAAARDQAIDAAEQIVVNINTVHPQSLDSDLATAQASLTGPMLTEYGKVRQKFADALRQSQANVSVRPAGASLTAFDDAQGTASALVAIDVTASSANTPPTQKQQLFQVEMQRTPDGWKAAKAAPSTGQG